MPRASDLIRLYVIVFSLFYLFFLFTHTIEAHLSSAQMLCMSDSVRYSDNCARSARGNQGITAGNLSTELSGFAAGVGRRGQTR
jgi:hypothetical protein